MSPNKLRHLRPAQPAVAGRPSCRWPENEQAHAARRLDRFWFLSRDVRRTDEDDANGEWRARRARDAELLGEWLGVDHGAKNLPRLPDRVRYSTPRRFDSFIRINDVLLPLFELSRRRFCLIKLNSSRISISFPAHLVPLSTFNTCLLL